MNFGSENNNQQEREKYSPPGATIKTNFKIPAQK